jgi:hypothetical protein
MPLNIAIRPVFAPYRPSGCNHGHRFWRKNRVVALWKSLSEAGVQKSQNGPSTQLIKATSCVERSNATMKAEELSYLSSYQTLTTDKNRRSYQSAKKLIKKWTVAAVVSC